MKKVMYDLTYAARGKSGIPRDTRSVAVALAKNPEIEIEYVLSPMAFIPRVIWKKEGLEKNNRLLESIFESKREIHIAKHVFNLFKVIKRSLSPRKKIKIEYLNKLSLLLLLRNLGINNFPKKRNFKIGILQIPYASRFLRAICLRSFKLPTKNIDFYIQQNIDPIQVNSKTTHIIRLHDILPITHPFFFSKRARFAFQRGLRSHLLNKNVMWVMDTEASKKEFLQNFGKTLNVEVIPCEVGFGLNVQDAYKSLELKFSQKNKHTNMFLCVNTIEPRKNIGIILEAFLSLINDKRIDPKDLLVIAGNKGWLQEEITLKLQTGYFGSQVKFIENPTDFEVQRLYSKADFIVSASEAEGFGLPPLEGALFGCIPIVSDIPQHRETLGSEVIFFEKNRDSLEKAILAARSISLGQRKILALTLHSRVQEKFSSDAVYEKWAKLLSGAD